MITLWAHDDKKGCQSQVPLRPIKSYLDSLYTLVRRRNMRGSPTTTGCCREDQTPDGEGASAAVAARKRQHGKNTEPMRAEAVRSGRPCNQKLDRFADSIAGKAIQPGRAPPRVLYVVEPSHAIVFRVWNTNETLRKSGDATTKTVRYVELGLLGRQQSSEGCITRFTRRDCATYCRQRRIRA